MRNIVVTAGAIALSLCATPLAKAESAREYSVQVSAQVCERPAEIQLHWVQDSKAIPSSYTVYRRAPDAADWGPGIHLDGAATNYVDRKVDVGVPYEYQIVKQSPGYTGFGYIDAGIRVPLTENRGGLLLVVDRTYAPELASELARLQQDLTGDGWVVQRIDVNRSDSVQHVKSRIQSAYQANPDHVKAVFLFGHVPVPYSGDVVPDGHSPDHQGAWPCDGYYGDMDGRWTDHMVQNTSATDPRNHNVPGDGKFDQSTFPAPLKLMIGRVDLANMPGRMRPGGPATFPSELDLLRNYLDKDHKFRHKLVPVPQRAVVGDYFGAHEGEAFAASGWRNFAPFVGPENVQSLPTYGTWIPTLSTNAYLWAYGCGAGSFTSIEGLGRCGRHEDGLTTDLVHNDVKAVFGMLYGSWLGDWDSEDNFLRAMLATPDYGLTSAWSGRPHWFLQHMALGRPIGFSTRLTQNNGFNSLYRTEEDNCASWIHIALMGDPTLRMQIVAPPAQVRSQNRPGAVDITWTPSSEPVQGYHVYRASNPNGPFTRINDSLVSGSSYTDSTANPGACTYMVRAIKLETSASGTYFNPSQGVFAQGPPTTANTVADNTDHALSNKPASHVSTVNTHEPAPNAQQRELNLPRLTPTGAASGTGANDVIWFDDALPAGAVASAEGGDAWNWTSANPTPFSGTKAHPSNLASGTHQQVFNWAYQQSMQVDAEDVLFTYVYLDPANPPAEIMLQWFDDNWEHRAYWGANRIAFGTDGSPSRRYMGPLPAAGQWVRLQVPASAVALENRAVLGMCFTAFDGRVAWDCTGKSSSADNTGGTGSDDSSSSGGASDSVWFDDTLPGGAIQGSDNGDSWNWISGNPTPFSGTAAHQSNIAAGEHQHTFNWAYQGPLQVNPGDVLFSYVYLDPANPPTEVMLQWFDSNWEHRAYWGANRITFGADGGASRRYMGPLPAAGQWVRLEVPASSVALENSTVLGMCFTLFDGRATWDRAGKSTALTQTNSTPPVVGSNSPPVVSTNQPPTTNSPPAASPFPANLGPGASALDALALQLPQPGMNALRVLSPNLLELKLINTKPSNSAPVSQWDLVNNGQFAAPPLNAFNVTLNGQTIPVQSVGFKRRPLYAPLDGYDLRIENCLYLQLATPISDNQSVEVKNPSGSLWPASTKFVSTMDPLRFSPAIHVNQEGYIPNCTKKAMVGFYLGSLGEMNVQAGSGFKLVNANNGTTVYQGQLTLRADVGWQYSPTPYQKVYEADFTGFNTPGQYKVVVPGLGASLPFVVNDSVAIDFTRAYALGLYHQRCGMDNALPYSRFAHDDCHVAPASIPASASTFPFTWTTVARYAQESNADNPVQTAPKLTSPAAQLFPFLKQGKIDVAGGHHDAGDYSKYTINSASFIHYLMFAVDSMPGVAALDNLGIPESGDGISDVLQEAKWEADFLAKMQDDDGGFYFLVYPENREYENNITPDRGDPQVVWPKTTSVTAAAVAALAQCGSSPAFKAAYPATAAAYMQKAQRGWQFLTSAVSHYGKNGAYQKITHYGDNFADQDELAWAASEMFVATGDPAIQQTLFSWFPDPASSTTFRWSWWRLYGSYGNAVRSYAFAVRSGRRPSNQMNAVYLAKCQQVVQAAGDDMLKWSQQSAYGSSFPEATKHVQGAGWYFSTDQAYDLAAAYQLNAKPEYIDALIANMNYEGGCNPVNVSYVTGLGWKRQRDVVSQYASGDRRVLPPSGIPVGNIQSGFQYLPNFQSQLQALCFPADSTSGSIYPYYDRWGDSWNVQAEFVILNSARSLGTLAFLAARTPLKSQAWKPTSSQIAVPTRTVAVGSPVTLSMQAPGLDLTGARITWDGRDQEPAFGQTFDFVPRNTGVQWVEAEAQFPDGRRVFASAEFNADSPNFVWVDDALPSGAQTSAQGGDTWKWAGSNPTPFSGSLAHVSDAANGLHQHSFQWANSTMAVPAGAVLYAYVYLDPANPPVEVMLQWNDGTWEHRAYWGANNITWGTDGTSGRRYMGPLPAAGQWVQLKVPASQVALEGSVVSGMGFSAYNGRVTWDAAGLLNPNFDTNSTTTAAVSVAGSDGSRIGSKPAVFTLTRNGDTTAPLTVNYQLAGTAINGTDYTLPDSSASSAFTIPAGANSGSLTVTPTAVNTVAPSKTVSLTLASSGSYSVASPGAATSIITGNTVPIASLKPTVSGSTLSWPSQAGAVYRVACKNNLSDPNWTYVGGEIPAAGAQTSWTDTAARPQRFYAIFQIR